MAKRTTIDLQDEDEAALKVVMKRWGQQNESATIRLCVHMVAQAKEMVLSSSCGSHQLAGALALATCITPLVQEVMETLFV